MAGGDETTSTKVPGHLSHLKTLGSSVAALVTLGGSFLAIDSHYASAADVNQNFNRIQNTMSGQVAKMRVDQLEDQIFMLEAKRGAGLKLTPVEAAMYSRYLRQRKDAQKILEDLQKLDKVAP